MTNNGHKHHFWLLLLPILALFIPSVVGVPVNAAEPQKQALATLVSTLDQPITEVITTSTPPVIYAHAYILIDAKTNQMLAGDNIHTQQPIASTTKMTTALIARNDFPLDKIITITKAAAAVGGSEVNFKVGEQLTMENILKGLLIPSGNDAAYSLAYARSNDGSEYQTFVKEMNDFAISHQLTDTQYQDPAGLNDDGHSSAYDLSQITRLLLQDNVLSQIVATPTETISSVSGGVTHQLTNTNRLIEVDSGYYMPSVIGVKTGFTPAAGHCLVAAEQVEGRTLIGVVLNTNDFSITASAAEMHKLFSWANNSIRVVTF